MNDTDKRSLTDALAIVSIAFVLRVGGIFITFLGYNTYAEGDARGFAGYAAAIAASPINPEFQIASGSGLNSVYVRWGGLLSPFWVLPGPSILYARIGMAILGTYSIYNVYLLARSLHSRRAGLIASIPLIFYPSYILLHSTVLREAMMLFCITTTARLLLVPSNLSQRNRWSIVILLLSIGAVLRPENSGIFLFTLLLGAGLNYWPTIRDSLIRIILVGSSLSAAFIAYPYVESLLNRIADIRLYRARGRTKYLSTIAADSVLEAIAFSWIGIGYFLYTPFPWMVTRIKDLPVAVEAIGNLGFSVFALLGARKYWSWEYSGTVALIIGFFFAVFIYGLATANVGTAVRHRPMFVWVIYLFGGIGLADHVRVHI